MRPPHKGKQEERQAGGQAGTRRKTSWETRQTRPREGGHTIQHRHTCRRAVGDKGGQDFGKADAPSNKKTFAVDYGAADSDSGTLCEV